MIVHYSAVFDSLSTAFLCHVQREAGFISSVKKFGGERLSFAAFACVVHLSYHKDLEILHILLSN